LWFALSEELPMENPRNDAPQEPMTKRDAWKLLAFLLALFLIPWLAMKIFDLF